MLDKRYAVEFHDGKTVAVTAASEAQAKILAQAERIRNGMNYLVKSVGELKE